MLADNPYWKVKVSIGGSDTKEVNKIIKCIGCVIDIVQTKDTHSEEKYFVLVEMVTLAQTEAAIGGVFNALVGEVKS